MKVLRIFLSLVLLMTFENMYAIYDFDTDSDEDYVLAEATGRGEDSKFEECVVYDFNTDTYMQTMTLHGVNWNNSEEDDLAEEDQKCLFVVKFKNGKYLYTIASVESDCVGLLLSVSWMTKISVKLTKYFILTGSEGQKLQNIVTISKIIKGDKWKMQSADAVIKMFSENAIEDMYLDGKSLFKMVPCARNLDSRRLFREFNKELKEATETPVPATAPAKPAKPASPAKHAKPAKPTTPATPAKPSKPATPAQPKKPAAQTKTSYRLPTSIAPSDIIYKPYGLSLDRPYTAEKMKSALNSCGTRYSQTKTGEIEVKNVPFTLNGKKPTSWKFSPNSSAAIPIQSFTFAYPQSTWSRSQAIAFAKEMVAELKRKGYKFADYSKEIGADYCQISVVTLNSRKYRIDVMVQTSMISKQTAYIVTIGTLPL